MPKKRQNLCYDLTRYSNLYTQISKNQWEKRSYEFIDLTFHNGFQAFYKSEIPQCRLWFPKQTRHKFNIKISSWKIQFMVSIILWYFLSIFYHTYLRLKNAFSVRPVQAVAMAMTKVVIPKVEWIGTRAARKDAVADSQHNKSKKLKKPTINWEKKGIH